MKSITEFWRTVLILEDVQAGALQLGRDTPLCTTLRKGERFEAVTTVEDIDEYTMFHDATTNLTFVVPLGTALELTRRCRGL